jgi:manganese/zinc/iron transport system permease protein
MIDCDTLLGLFKPLLHCLPILLDAMFTYNTLLVLRGVSILAASAGVIGTFAVLRRRALTGDALSHAALPGVCLAFILTGERRLPILLLGAFVSGLLGVMVMSWLRRWTRLKEDVCVGVVLSVFFGAGIAMVTWIGKNSSFDGRKKAGLPSFILGEASGMLEDEVELITLASVVCVIIVLLLYKELKLIAFDPGFARVQGWPASLLDLLLMTLLAVVVMIGLPAVGAVLMAALVILPGATARLWTDRLSLMLLLAGAIGAVTGGIGAYISSLYARLPAGPIIILVGTSFFLTSLAFAPRHGLLARWLSERRFRRELAAGRHAPEG